jgi:hypothetical protein
MFQPYTHKRQHSGEKPKGLAPSTSKNIKRKLMRKIHASYFSKNTLVLL